MSTCDLSDVDLKGSRRFGLDGFGRKRVSSAKDPYVEFQSPLYSFLPDN